MRCIGTVLLLLASLGAPTWAHEPAAPAQAKTDADPAKLLDPMSSLSNSTDAWSVSKNEAGCFLLSPRRANSSSLAIGTHPKLGLGLFIVGFGLSVSAANTGEAVQIQTGERELSKVGRLVGVRLFFVDMEPADVDASLARLTDSGSLWLILRHTWLAHSGLGVADAVKTYRKDCAAAG